MNCLLKWKKINDGATVPSKRNEDAGFDLYICNKTADIVLQPHETKNFGTGLISMFDENWVGLIKERGSTGSKGISVRSGVIDSGYRGEWIVTLTNENEVPVEFSNTIDKVTIIYKKWRKKKVAKILYPISKAIAQVIFVPVPTYTIKPLTDEDLKNDNSERGASGWGASGK